MTKMNGKAYTRALMYAISACPKADTQSALSHVVFYHDKIICADGRHWMVGRIADGSVAPVAIARDSIADLLVGLKYAYAMSQHHGGHFVVFHKDEETVVIEYGKKTLVHELIVCNLGELPEDWKEPVAPDAALADGVELPAGLVRDAVDRYTSWGKDRGKVVIRGGSGGKGLFRIDQYEGDEEFVGSAFILPLSREPAVLPAEGLFEGIEGSGRKLSQSILDLQYVQGTAPVTPIPAKKKRGAKKDEETAEPVTDGEVH